MPCLTPVRAMLLRYLSLVSIARSPSTDVGATAGFLLETYARRWTLAVTFHDAKHHLGFEDPQNQSPRAVRQTAPLAALVYGMVLLWYADRVRTGTPARWVSRPWYATKATPSFLDSRYAHRAPHCRVALLHC